MPRRFLPRREASSGQTFDLRRLKAADRTRFDSAVRKSKGQMPPWQGVLVDDQIDSIWAYIRANPFER
jgi:mono/diheme cytochrome c family protein